MRCFRFPAFAIAAAGLALALGACGEDDDSSASQATDDTVAETAPDSPPAPDAAGKGGGCRQVKAPAAKPDGDERKPAAKLDPAKTYDVVFETNCGSFTIRLDVKAAPATTASFVALARKGFFDGTIFHRIVPGFVIQGGDPTGTGTGGPGYSTVDRPPQDAAYTKGVVAMAKTEAEPPGTAGSQFYVVTGADAELPPEYALLGEVERGLDVTQRIGRLGDPASATGEPTQPVVIAKATVRER
ncbi:MAG: peptidylprolyl isomerase [Thermoleophilaceae bacterium]